MVWIAAVLAVFLFYKFVERPHKVIFFKIVGVIAVIGGIVLAGIFVYEELLPRKTYSENLTVEYVSHKSTLNIKEKQKIAEKVFKDMIDKKSYILEGLNAEELEVAKNYIFEPYFPNNASIRKITYSNENDLQQEIEDLFSGDSEKSKVAGKKYDEFYDAKLREFVGELEELRKKYSDTKGLRKLAYIHAIRIDYLPKNQKAIYEKSLNEAELKKVSQLKEQIETFHESSVDDFNNQNKDTEIGFKICNKKNNPLNSYYFYVSGFVKDRSTPTTLEAKGYGEDTRFNGDIIIKPNECNTITWTGRYRFFHRYEIKTIGGTWADQ